MTRKETLEHAREIVNRIFHGHENKVTIKGWVARSSYGDVCFFDFKPRKTYFGDWNRPLFPLDDKAFPSVKWEDEEPTEAEITIRIKK